MAALQIKNLPTGAGDDFKIDASYAKGATKAVVSTSGGSPSFTMFGSTSVPGGYQSIGFGATTESVYLPVANGGDEGRLHLTDAWGVRGAFNHNWDPYWSTASGAATPRCATTVTSADILTAKGQFCASFNCRQGRCLRTTAATRTSTLPRLVWSPAGLPSRT